MLNGVWGEPELSGVLSAVLSNHRQLLLVAEFLVNPAEAGKGRDGQNRGLVVIPIDAKRPKRGSRVKSSGGEYGRTGRRLIDYGV